MAVLAVQRMFVAVHTSDIIGIFRVGRDHIVKFICRIVVDNVLSIGIC